VGLGVGLGVGFLVGLGVGFLVGFGVGLQCDRGYCEAAARAVKRVPCCTIVVLRAVDKRQRNGN